MVSTVQSLAGLWPLPVAAARRCWFTCFRARYVGGAVVVMYEGQHSNFCRYCVCCNCCHYFISPPTPRLVSHLSTLVVVITVVVSPIYLIYQVK
jgi:hypothetical protein